jgi:NCS1 family nucleobase:cation symporter-1
MFWLGIQSANGALAMQIMIMAIWPSFSSYDWGGSHNQVDIQSDFQVSIANLP